MTTANPGLRERKKQRTRQAIRKAALDLFTRQGYDATTTEQIAAAAEVSSSTLFRYFATKELIVLTDEYDPIMLAELERRPPDEPLMDSLRAAFTVPFREVYPRDRDEILARLRLIRDVPAIRAQLGMDMGETGEVLSAWLAERRGTDPGDLQVRTVVAALMGAWTAVFLYWAETDGEADLPDLFDKATDHLVEAFRG